MVKKPKLKSLQSSYKLLEDYGFVTDLVFPNMYAYRTESAGKAIYIISGIHGDEPAGPIAISESIDVIERLSKKYAVVLLPLCNPEGYKNGWRYLTKDKELSVGDSEHLLINPRNQEARGIMASSSESLELTNYILTCLNMYPPIVSIDLHEDDKLEKGYIYSQGIHGCDDPIAKKILSVLSQSVAIQLDGKTRFGEEIKGGIVSQVCDGSIDELIAAPEITSINKITKKNYAESVIVVETPSKNILLKTRVAAHKAVIASLEHIL